MTNWRVYHGHDFGVGGYRAYLNAEGEVFVSDVPQFGSSQHQMGRGIFLWRYLGERNETLTGSDPTPIYEIPQNPSLVPEPGTWALLIAGLGLAGAALRRRRTLIA